MRTLLASIVTKRVLIPIVILGALIPATVFAGVTTTVDFNSDPQVAVSDGWSSVDSADLSFSNGSGGMRILHSPPNTTSNAIASFGLGVELTMTFTEPMESLSLAFGNDDPRIAVAGDFARLTAFDGATQVVQTDVVFNLNDEPDQTISVAGVCFDSVTFVFVTDKNLTEVADDIVFETCGPAEPGDTTPPTLIVPDAITVEADTSGGTSASNPAIAAFLASASATDDVDPSPVVGDNAPGFFALGLTTVTFTATDDSGNSVSGTSTVTVEDTTDPTVSVSVVLDTLWSPNHKLVDVGYAQYASDTASEVTLSVTVVSDEDDNGKGDGNSADDIQWDEGTLLLRSERAGGGDGRTYTITVTATDSSGNSATDETTVTVPKSQGKKK